MRIATWLTGMGLVALVGVLVLAPAARAAGADDAFKQMQADKMTLVKAAEVAEKHSKGKAVAAHAAIVDKNGVVIVHCLVGDKCQTVTVDMKTAKAEKMTDATAAEEKEAHVGTAKDIVKAMTDDKMTLAKAVEAAETHAKGTAESVMTKHEGSKLEFVVKIGGDKPATLTVDGKTGKVKSDAKKVDDKKKDEKKDDKKAPKKP